MTSSPHIESQTPLPRVFGRYLLLQRLSRGGMGEIFLAKHGLSGFEKLCVIKKVLPQLSADRHFISRFVDEAQVAIHLQHANVAQVFEVGCVGNEYFLALEYIEGRDLRRTMTRLKKKRRQFPIDLALLIARELANGLAYAHRRLSPEGEPLDLVHCDISPPNVVVSFEGEVKIIDFGIAKSAMRITVTDPKMGFGKFGYMSPEQLVRGGQVDQRTDIYAAGTVLYEMLTGTKLHNVTGQSDYRAVVKQVLDGKHAKPSDIDVELEPFDELVLRAVHPKVKSRFQTAGEFRDAVQQLLVQRNPTISSDSLAAFMRDVFHEDIQELQRLASTAHATEMAPFEPEIADQSVQSVSFASSLDNLPELPDADSFPDLKPPPPPAPPPVPSAAADARSSSQSGQVVIESRSKRKNADDQAPTTVWRGNTGQPHGRAQTPITALPVRRDRQRKQRLVFALGGLGIVVLIIVIALLVGGSGKSLPAAAADAAPAVTEVADVPDAGLVPDAAERVPDAQSTETDSPKSRPRPTRERPKSVATGPTREQVTKKFQKVKKAYLKFEKSFGKRLADRWSDLVHDLPYANSPDKLKSIDGRLDRFAGEMKAVQAAAQ